MEEEITSELGCCSDPVGTTQYTNQTRHQCKIRSENYVFTSGNCLPIANTTQTILQSTTQTGTKKESFIYLSLSNNNSPLITTVSAVPANSPQQTRIVIATDTLGIV
ncbi:MAG: hypothetical protein ACK55I_37795, partial [bacterium]